MKRLSTTISSRLERHLKHKPAHGIVQAFLYGTTFQMFACCRVKNRHKHEFIWESYQKSHRVTLAYSIVELGNDDFEIILEIGGYDKGQHHKKISLIVPFDGQSGEILEDHIVPKKKS